MNYLSFNIKGAGGSDKAAKVRKLKRDFNLSFIAIQETQFCNWSEDKCGKFWDSSSFDKVWVDAVGRSGGLLSMWNSNLFNASDRVVGQNFILVGGSIRGDPIPLYILNVYAPVNPVLRRSLWYEILCLKEAYEGRWIVLGDFNEVRSIEERCNSSFHPGNAAAFNDFIASAGLSEYHMGGRKFTFMSGDGSKLSKLDRVLVCDRFLSAWPDANLTALEKDVSDHSPIVLSFSANGFGPIPFRFFNSWIGLEGVDEIVAEGLCWGVESNAKDLVFK